MLWKDFFREEDGGILTTEMILYMGLTAAIVGTGAFLLTNALSDYFTGWANFFNTTGGS